jgi:hypothetical protein
MGRWRGVAVVGPALVLAGAIGACDAGPTPSSIGPTSSAAAGSGLPTTGHVVATDRGFSVTFPDGWTRIDVGTDTMSAIERIHGSALGDAERNALETAVKRYQAVTLLDHPSSPLLAVRVPNGRDTAISLIAVAHVPLTGTVTPDDAEAAMLDQIRKSLNPKIEISTSHVIGPAGRFLRISYDAAIANSTTNVGLIAYDVIGPTGGITVTCTTFGSASSIAEPCEATALSTRFEPEAASPGPTSSR